MGWSHKLLLRGSPLLAATSGLQQAYSSKDPRQTQGGSIMNAKITRAGFLSLFILTLVCLPALADQKWTTIDDADWCDDHRSESDFCEVRETTLDADRKTIQVDGGDNGGISVKGWDEDKILLRAKIRVWDDDEPEDLVAKITIETGKTIKADGPRGLWGRGWSVSFELMVPHKSNLELETTNGSIRIHEVQGDIDFSATNGSILLSGIGGDVRGRTTNGSLDIEFEGNEWTGKGLDAKTTNGGIKLWFPEDYSAELVTGTVNGSIRLDSPMRVQGTIGRKLRTTLGGGGAEIKVTTTNGGVKIKQG